MTQQIPDVEMLPAQDFTELPEDGLTMREIYELIASNGDVILTIPEAEVKRVREGLSGVKAKINQKLKANDLPPETSTLEFAVLQWPPLLEGGGDPNKGMVRLQCYLKYPDKVKVTKVEIVKDEDL